MINIIYNIGKSRIVFIFQFKLSSILLYSINIKDLTINQRQYDLQTEQFQQSQSNILGGLSEAAGSSGIAGVAQALAQQGQLQAQQSSANIGDQERQNQMMERQMAGQIQAQEREGEVLSREMEMDKQGTLLGMAQVQFPFMV